MRVDALPLVLIRRFLGVVFIAYGTVKLFGGQFIYSDWTITRGTASGPYLVWAFFGYSPAYAKFIALCELIPGILLLVPRTAFLGAAALFPVALNITVMDFAYDFPGVKYLAAFYTALLGLLLWVEREKLLLFLEPITRVRAVRAAPMVATDPPPRGSPAIRRAVNVVSAVFILWVANMVVEVSTDGPGPRALAAARGADSLVLARARMSGQSGIMRTAVVQLRSAAESTTVATVYLTRPLGFVPWRVDSVVRALDPRRLQP